ncbi:MAG: hypothetical protein ABJP34_04345 [Erythrobacter sp.]
MKKPIQFSLNLAAAAVLLAACSQPQSSEEPANEQADNSETAGDADGNTGAKAPDAPVEMPVMTQTGWRVQGEDGSVYTTFFDADGTYRDFKNGEPMQAGTWEERVDGNLCFTPSTEGRIGECWALAPVDMDGMMKPVSDAGKSVELRQVTYIAPAEES